MQIIRVRCLTNDIAQILKLIEGFEVLHANGVYVMLSINETQKRTLENNQMFCEVEPGFDRNTIWNPGHF